GAVAVRRLALLYLNSVAEGGETLFFHQNVAVKPEAGKLVIFPAGFTHVHKGQRPISNDKYIINGWIVEGEHWLPPKPDIP
ncbi:MAG: 2OG-Fe(II) oxygenase, partial [Gammaproteobacteria bacterium]